MEKSAILHADLLDIVFEGRNKEYGAYDLRRTYNKRLRVSVAVMLLVTMLLCIGQLIASRQKPAKEKEVLFVDDVTLEKVDPQPEIPPPTPPPTPPPQQVQTIQYTAPVIVDEDVPEDQKPPDLDDLEDAKIDLVTNPDGDKDAGIVAPPLAPPGTGLVEAPRRKDNPDSLFIVVQIESSYPGGDAAWRRYLIKNIRYPQDAQDNGIQGPVMVQFIVDKEGVVSNVEALSGPEELRGEAVRVIKKSGKWTPAIQNGMQVKSYKRQQITFAIENQ